MALKLNDTLRNMIETSSLFIALVLVMPKPWMGGWGLTYTASVLIFFPPLFFFAISRYLGIRPVGWAYSRYLIELVLFGVIVAGNQDMRTWLIYHM